LTSHGLACLDQYTFVLFYRSQATTGAICLPPVHGGAPEAAGRGAQMVEHHPVQAEELRGQPHHQLRELADLQRGAQGDRQSQGEAREHAGELAVTDRFLLLPLRA